MLHRATAAAAEVTADRLGARRSRSDALDDSAFTPRATCGPDLSADALSRHRKRQKDWFA
jgi:hypothetical protein